MSLSIETGSHTETSPYLIYTADGSQPREIDDGIFVQRVDDMGELYSVGVCVADTSKKYSGEARVQAMSNVHAEYWDLPDGELGYDPMIDQCLIKNTELTEGNVRNALIVKFMIGACVEPTDVNVVFGKVEVKQNLTYKKFSSLAQFDQNFNKFARVANLIRTHIGYTQGGDSSGRNKEGERVRSVSQASWKHGARINEAYMVAANHFAGVIMRDEERAAIYRVHDVSDNRYAQFIESNCAVYQREPGVHEGLRLNPYCRVTSPLRRLEDFIMSHHFRLRYEGCEPSRSDIEVMSEAIRALNKRAIFESLSASASIKAKQQRIRQQNDAATEQLNGSQQTKDAV